MFGIKLPKQTSLIVALLIIILLVYVTLYKTKKVNITQFIPPTKGVVQTNQWYSSAYFENWPETFFVYPLAVKIESAGISLSYPKIVPTPKTIYSQFEKDITVSGSHPFEKQTIIATGDMHIVEELKSDSQVINAVIAHGLPTVWMEYVSGDKELIISGAVNAVATRIDPQTARILINNKSYLIKTDSKSVISIDSSNTVQIILATNGFVSITLDPDGIKLDASQIADPLLSSVFAYPNLIYFFPNNQKSVIAMLPHQWNKYGSNFLGSYTSLRGEMKVIYDNQITLKPDEAQILKITDMVAKLSDNEKGELQQKVLNDFNEMTLNPEPAAVYDEGKWIFKLAQIAEIAKAVNYKGSNAINQRLSKSLQNWLGENSGKWTVIDSPKGVIAVTPQFGNEEFNDHNFHYGYFLAAAGIGLELDPSIKNTIKPGIDLLLSDVANTDRSSPYPYLRGFDAYEGHSWASGKSIFADGNNQESTSEAVNRWYGIYRVGVALGDKNLVKTGTEGLSMEEESAKTYWLLQNPDVYKAPVGYTSEIVSILWGGKADFATWFSALPTHIYGIQFLPMTPAMTYLKGTYSQYLPQSEDSAWNDIHDMVQAENGIKVSDSQTRYEAGNSSSFYYLWVKYWSSQFREGK